MATITKLGLQDPANQLGASPYGNLTAFRYVLKTIASGAVEGGDSTTAVASGDTVKIGLLPAGFRLIDSEISACIILRCLPCRVLRQAGGRRPSPRPGHLP